MKRLSGLALLLRSSEIWTRPTQSAKTNFIIVQPLESTHRGLSTSSICRYTNSNSTFGDRKYLASKQSTSPLQIRDNIFCIPVRLLSICTNHSDHKIRTTVLANRSLQQKREMSSKISDEEIKLLNKFKPREVQFKTPYGHIAGLEWGLQDAPNKILCTHGWLDNAGSFERLVPFILDYKDNHELYHVVAIDMPGVGHSSHKPPGAEYTTLSNIVEMRRVSQQLGWNKLTLLSHSQGSHFSFLYSCIYPEQVETLITIDLAHPLGRQVNNWNISVANSIEEHFKCEYHHEDDPTSNIRVPVYSEVDAIKRLMDAHSNSLTRESAEVLLKRGATKQRWGYTFNRDVRLRYLSLELRPNEELMLQFMDGPFKSNLLIIRANRSPYHRSEELRLKYYDIYKRNCPIFHDTILEGTHHLHMNSPETVAPEINKFLEEVKMSSKSSILPKSKL